MAKPSPTEALPVSRRALFLTFSPDVYDAVREQLTTPEESTSPEGLLLERGVLSNAGSRWETTVLELDFDDAGTWEALLILVRRIKPAIVMVLAEGWLASPGIVIGRKIWAPMSTKELFYELPLWLAQRLRAALRRSPIRTKHNVQLGDIGPVSDAVISFDNQDSVKAESNDIAQALQIWSSATELPWLFLCGPSGYPSARALSQVAIELLSVVPTSHSTTAPETFATLYVSHVAIEALRSLRELHWFIPPERACGWHVIIGNNGAGKSTFLRAVALAMMGEEDAQALRQDNAGWLRQGADYGQVTIIATPLAPPPAPADPSDASPPAEARVRFSRAGTPPTIHKQHSSDLPILFSAAFGPFRRLSGGDPDLERDLAAYPRALRNLTLFSERPALAQSLDWLKHLHHRAVEQPEGAKERHFLAQVLAFLSQPDFLPHGTKLTSVSADAIRFRDGNGCEVQIEELSDGFRSILGLTMELLRHLTTAHGPETLFTADDPPRVAAAGVVLIDEVDAHLHPTWQRQIGIILCRLFPEMQFIVSSHSPLVCQAAEQGTVFLLPEPGSDQAGRMLAGNELDRVRFGDVLDAYGTGVFGAGVTRSEKSKEMLSELARLNLKELDEGLSPEEQTEQTRLRGILVTAAYVLKEPPDDPHPGA